MLIRAFPRWLALSKAAGVVSATARQQRLLSLQQPLPGAVEGPAAAEQR